MSGSATPKPNIDRIKERGEFPLTHEIELPDE